MPLLAAQLFLTSVLLAPGPATTPPVVGEVVTPAAAGRSEIVVRKDGAGETVVQFDATTAFLRTRPGATTLDGATPLIAADVAAGDRVLCQGALSDDGRTFRARRVVVMARTDVESLRAKEKEDWRRRGSSGVVEKTDPVARQIVLRAVRGGVTQSLLVDASGAAISFRRYGAGSARFADSRASRFEELAVGDQVRVLGDKTADGSRVVAEQVVSGAFRVLRGILGRVAGELLTVRDDARGAGTVTVTMTADTLVRRLPPMMVARLTRTAAGEAVPQAAEPDRGGRAGDPDDVLERLPALPVSELQPGEAVAVLGPKGEDTARLAAIKLVAWTPIEMPVGRGGGRGRGGDAPADPFADLLGNGGDGPW